MKALVIGDGLHRQRAEAHRPRCAHRIRGWARCDWTVGHVGGHRFYRGIRIPALGITVRLNVTDRGAAS